MFLGQAPACPLLLETTMTVIDLDVRRVQPFLVQAIEAFLRDPAALGLD
jgi:hypothetical protein